MKKVMLIGDSIRGGYQPYVTKALEDRAQVWAPNDNCRFSSYTLWCLPSWLSEMGSEMGKEVDVIHWNNGIWESFRHFYDREPLMSVPEYVRCLSRILGQLRSARPGAKIIFALTTPVAPGFRETTNEIIGEFNAAARKLMEAEGVEINDLNALIAQNPGYIAEDKLHLTDEGYAAAGAQVAAVIGKYLD